MSGCERDGAPRTRFFMSTITPQSLAALIEQHGPALQLYARQLCSTPEDVVQEAFMKLLRQRTQPEAPVAWLYRVVRNGAFSAARAAQRRRRREQQTAAPEPAAWFDSQPGSDLDATAAVTALAKLSHHQREAVVAHLWGELTFEEMGHLLGCSSSTAHRTYTDGLRTMKEILCPCAS